MKTRINTKGILTLAVAFLLVVLVSGLALADDYSVDNDVYHPGNQNNIDLTAAPGESVTTSFQILVDYKGNKHLLPSTTVTFAVNSQQTNLPGYTGGNVSFTVPAEWGTSTFQYATNPANISFTAPSAPGNYQYQVKWSDSEQCVADRNPGDCLTGADALNINLTVQAPPPPPNTAPTADAGGPYTGPEGSSISINGASASDTDGDSLTYIWTKIETGFDAGAQCSLIGETTLTPSLTCTDDGSVDLTLTVGDGHDHMVSAKTIVTVTNANPVIDSVTNNGPVFEGSPVTINIIAHDPGSNDSLSYAFDCENDGTYENSTGTCSFVDNVGSPFTVGVLVSDDDQGSAKSSTQVTVNNANPVVAVPAWSSATVNCRAPVKLNNISFSDAGVIDFPWTMGINWGDGSPVVSTTTQTQGLQSSQTYAYNTPGLYTATVGVTDKDGGYGENATSGQLKVLQTYTVNFLQPFDGSSPSNLITNTMKSGRVVPVKVTIYDDCAQAYVTDPTTMVKIFLSAGTSTGATSEAIDVYADAGASNSNTLYFRWTSDLSVPGGGFWIYNLDSKTALNGSAMALNTTYRVDVYVGSVKATSSTWAYLKPVK